MNYDKLTEYCELACDDLAYELAENRMYTEYKSICNELLASGRQLSLDQLQFVFAYRMGKLDGNWQHYYMSQVISD